MEPYIIEIPYQSPLELLQPFALHVGTVLLYSAQFEETFGRYSFLGIDPLRVLTAKDHIFDAGVRLGLPVQDPFSAIRDLLDYPIVRVDSLPPFQGGLMGYFAYELGHYFEKFPIFHDDLHIPDLKLGCYDLVISFDHLQKRAWIISSGWPHREEAVRWQRAKKRAEWVMTQLVGLMSVPLKQISAHRVNANFNQHTYVAAVRQVIDYIYAGDIFQANMSRRFEAMLPEGITEFDLFTTLSRMNPAPFAAYLKWPELSIVSASPERFLSHKGGMVETKPIKGTRPRGVTAAEDQCLAHQLLNSDKDRAENLMIVDLLRNDLSRVCQPHSVKVPKLLELESYTMVHHLVSTVVGQLKPEYDVVDLIKASFPGGSITGAPKIRAMEIIAELEQVRRGVYCGAIGYIGFDGVMDTNIAIRTFTKLGQRLIFNAGGGVVADSDPLLEFEETTTKALALLRVLGQ